VRISIQPREFSQQPTSQKGSHPSGSACLCLKELQMNTIEVQTADFGFPGSIPVIGLEASDNHLIPAQKQYTFRRELFSEVSAFLEDPFGDALCLIGPEGSGKTSVVEQICSRLNWPVTQVEGREEQTFDKFVGKYIVQSIFPGDPPEMSWQDGPLTTAMKKGYVLLINEFNGIEPGENIGFNDVIEGRPLVISENGGEVVHPHPNFRLIVTGNMGADISRYAGTVMQSPAFIDRFRISVVDYMDPQDEVALLSSSYPELPEKLIMQIISFANHIRQAFQSESYDEKLSYPISTRTLLRWCRLIVRYLGKDDYIKYTFEHAYLRRYFQKEEVIAIHRMAKDIFGDKQWETSEDEVPKKAEPPF
jgi:cobaltochelatase CobS